MLLYGLGIKSLAERLNCSEDEAKNIIEATYTAYPKLREYITNQQQYPLDHGGYVKTIFGDKLFVKEYEWLQSATSMGEVRSLTARIQRLGVNLPKTNSASENGKNKYIKLLEEDYILDQQNELVFNDYSIYIDNIVYPLSD